MRNHMNTPGFLLQGFLCVFYLHACALVNRGQKTTKVEYEQRRPAEAAAAARSLARSSVSSYIRTTTGVAVSGDRMV